MNNLSPVLYFQICMELIKRERFFDNCKDCDIYDKKHQCYIAQLLMNEEHFRVYCSKKFPANIHWSEWLTWIINTRMFKQIGIII